MKVLQLHEKTESVEAEISKQCGEEVTAVLNKHGCEIVFEQVFRNGLPVASRYAIVYKPKIVKAN